MKTLKNYIDSVVNKVLRESLEEKADEIINKLNSNSDEESDMNGFEELEFNEEDMNESECSECGGMMSEGECSECGYKMEGLYEESDPNSQKCKYHKENFGPDDERTIRFCGKNKVETKEGKKFPDLSGDGKVTRKDVLLGRGVKLNGKKSETKEGKKFPDLSGDGKVTRKDVLMGRGVKLNGKDKKSTNESVKLTEDEMIDLIERIVNEEKDNIKKQSSAPGLSITKRNLDKSKKENDDYIKSVTKKMKEYLKDGSKEDYTMEAEHFPESNGQMDKKMAKKTYKASDAVEEYIEAFSSAGQENLVYDEIHPNEDWVSDNIEGSSRTGNNPKWANSVESNVNKNRNKIRKENLLGALKKQAYNKSPQPVVTDEAGEVINGGKNNSKKSNTKTNKIMNQLESTEEKKEKLIKEDIDKMNRMLGYNKKTQ
jgi:hypothetical protein